MRSLEEIVSMNAKPEVQKARIEVQRNAQSPVEAMFRDCDFTEEPEGEDSGLDK